MFKTGEKIVCIKPIYNLIENEIYTINTIVNCSCGHIMFTLQGVIKNTYNNSGTRCNCNLEHQENDLFGINRFRKLDYDFAENLLAKISKLALQ